MNEFARIESIDALKNLRTFLCSFAHKITVAVDEADFDIQDASNWLKHDRYPFWEKELRRREEQLIKAKLELKRKQVMERAIGGHDSCIDEIKAFRAAQKRFDEAQDKFKKIKSWTLKLEKEGFDCRAALQSLGGFMRTDLANYVAQIDQMLISLESYVNVSSPMTAEQYAGDDMQSVGHVEYPVEKMQRLCGDLRNLNPLRVALNIPPQSPVPASLTKLVVSDRMRQVLKKNKKEAFVVSESAKLAFDGPFEPSDFIYFERLIAANNHAIEGFVGHIEAKETSHISVCDIADFLKECPVFEDILSLPEGWMIFIKNNSVESIFNADNKLVTHS